MIPTTAVIGIVFIVGLLVFFWKRNGVGSGRAFGNRIADKVGISRKVFHMLYVNGVADASGDALKALQEKTPDLDQASIAVGPVLSKGIQRMEARFGRQEMIDEVKPTVARLLAEFNASR